MKNSLKLLGITLVLCIGLGFIACENNANNGGINDGGDPGPFDITAAELVSRMRVGWNMGNSLDAATGSGSAVHQMEQWWGVPPITRENIRAIREAGFNLIRIPITWAKAVDPNTFIIREDWMMRVMQIVNWAYEEELFIIINTHHDSGDVGQVIFSLRDDQVEGSLVRFRIIWEQIAATFRYFEERLIFSPLNEPRVVGTGVTWTGREEYYINLNRHYQLFVDTVRASGANNRYRFFLFTTYAASRTLQAMNGLVLPDDPSPLPNRHIVSYHAYVPSGFSFGGAPGSASYNNRTWSPDGRSGRDALDITEPLDQFYQRFVANGIPVIIGEFGATDKDNVEARADMIYFYTRQARDRGMPVIIWDNHQTWPGPDTNNNERFGLFDRDTNTFFFPEIVDALMRGSQD